MPLQTVINYWRGLPILVRKPVEWFLIGGLCVWIATKGISNGIYWAVLDQAKEAVHEEKFKNSVAEELGKNLTASYQYKSFFMGRKAQSVAGTVKDDSNTQSARIYASENQKAFLVLRVLQYQETGKKKYKNVEIYVKGVRVKGLHIDESPDYKNPIELTDTIAEARKGRVEKTYDENMFDITFRYVDAPSSDYVWVEAHIITVGLPKIPEGWGSK